MHPYLFKYEKNFFFFIWKKMITYNYSSRKIFCHILFFSSLYQLINGTPLDDYVNEPDDNYKYEILKMVEFVDYKLFYINMTSQKWQNGNYSLKLMIALRFLV